MSTETVTAVLLIVVPIAFNVAFFELGRAFDYPNILRKEPDEILRRFAAGGSGLILRWEALLVSALAMLPLAALLAVVLGAPPALTRPVDRRRRGRGARPGARARALAVRRAGAGPPLRRGPGRTRRRCDPADRRGRVRDAPPPARRRHRRAPRLPADRPLDAPGRRRRSSRRRVLPGLARHRRHRRSASPCSSARSSSSGRTSATAGRWPGRSCRSPTSPGRSG